MSHAQIWTLIPAFLIAILALSLGAFRPVAAQSDTLTVTIESEPLSDVRVLTDEELTAAPELMVKGRDAGLRSALQRMIDYRDRAWELGIEGPGRVQIQIDTSGQVVEAMVMAGWGHGLDEEVLEAVRQLTFTPAQTTSGPVTAILEIPIRLSLP